MTVTKTLLWCSHCGCGNDSAGFAHLPGCVNSGKPPTDYAAEVRAVHPGITDAGVMSFWRSRHLPTD